MEETSQGSRVPTIDYTGLLDPTTTFEKMQALLKAKDDTSRFVGLALLKAVLDNGQLVDDPERLCTLWESLSPKFLDRLLRARQNEKASKADAKDMVDLAVAVLHTFTILLPEESRKGKRLTGRTAPLVKALIQSPPETTKLILQTLLTIVSRPEGALELLGIDDLSPLTEIATANPLVLQIINFGWTNASTIPTEVQVVRKRISETLPKLLLVFKGTDAVTLIEFVGDLLPKLIPEAIPNNPKWLPDIVATLRKLIVSKPTLAGRAAYTRLASALLQVYPATTPGLIFKDGTLGSVDSKPFSYLLINLLLIDLRSSFPTLLAKLNSDEYPATSQRLAAAFDVLSSFIGFLVRTLDDDATSPSFSMPPDLLLKLRKNIAETLSLTIEYLRDRWDASVAGASGLHHSVRTGTAATSEGTRLTLAWDSIKDNVNSDPLILAGIRGLAIWIREDENENLRNETAGLMDMLVELYKSSFGGALDFRYPILLALEGIMVTEEGVEAFLGQGGWQIVFQDLQSALKVLSDLDVINTPAASEDAARGIQIVRVLLAIVDHPSINFPQEDWMTVVTTAASIKVPSARPPSIVLEFQIAMLQLSTALLSKSSGGMTKRYATSQPALSGLATRLETLTKNMSDEVEAAEFRGLLEDVLLDIGNLGFSQ